MEKEGEAIITEIVPGKPAYLTAIEEIEVNPTFGGIYIHTTNGGRNYLIFDVSTKDSKGNWNVEHTEYTSVKTSALHSEGSLPNHMILKSVSAIYMITSQRNT